MKIPVLLMTSLLAVGVSAQTAKPVQTKKPVKKVKKQLQYLKVWRSQNQLRLKQLLKRTA